MPPLWKRGVALLGLLAGAALLSGFQAPSTPACPTGQAPARTVQLFFGRAIGDRVGVSEADFARFVEQELTPRFPEGLTILDADGRWRPKGGRTVHEPSKVVILALPDESEDDAKANDAKIKAVRDTYIARFSQKSVMVVSHPVCLGF